MTKSSRFGRTARLAPRGEFRRVFEQGRKTVGRWLILWHFSGPAERGARLGLSVSSKLGGAVRRNRIKRLLREAFRLRRNALSQGLDLVAYPRPGCPWEDLADALKDMDEVLRRAKLTS